MNLLLQAKETKLQNGMMLANVPWVQDAFAKIYYKLEALKLICWKQVWSQGNDNFSMTDASVAKVYERYVYKK